MTETKDSVNALWIWDLRWTFPEDTPIERALEIFNESTVKYAKRWVYQVEKGTKTQRNHIQAYWSTKEKTRRKALYRRLNLNMSGIRVKEASDKGKDRLMSYCMKSDTRVRGPFSDRPIYLGSDLVFYDKFYPWQKSLLSIATGAVSNGKVHWVYDPVGQQGKTMLGKSLAYTHGAVYLPYATASNIAAHVVSKGPQTIYIINLTRSRPKDLSMDDLYSAMEGLSDGFVVNMKFKTGDMMFDPPHVIVFANIKPNMASLSRGRFILYTIEDKQLIKC